MLSKTIDADLKGRYRFVEYHQLIDLIPVEGIQDVKECIYRDCIIVHIYSSSSYSSMQVLMKTPLQLIDEEKKNLNLHQLNVEGRGFQGL